MTQPVYGVLLVSFSRHSHQRSFIPAFRHHPRLRLVAVADEPDIEPALRQLNIRWAEELGIPYIEGIDEGVRRTDVDIVSICHEIERRADIAVRAAGAGKHLWIDKFMGASLAECDAVVQAVRRAGVASIIPNYVYNDLVLQSRRALASGMIGDLLGLHADVMFSKGMPRPIPDDRRPSALVPPGRWKYPDIKRELLTVGAYAVGLIQCCLERIVEVYGQAGAYFFPEHAGRAAEDFGILTMVDEKGRVATLSAGRIGVGTHPAGGPLEAYLTGTAGTAFIDGKRPRFDTFVRRRILEADYTPSPDDPMQWASGPPALSTLLGADPNRLALEDFLQALDTGGQPRYTVREARDHMEILLGGYYAILQGAPVPLPLREEAYR
jgi:predicted dehydrogenase